MVAARLAAEALIVDVDGLRGGRIDVLLTLSRTQKVDLRQISVLALAQQYLAFVEKARTLRDRGAGGGLPRPWRPGSPS